MQVGILGAGAWGTALAVHLARQGHAVQLWVRETELVAHMRERRENPRFLPGVELPVAVAAGDDPAAAVRGAGWVIGVVPSAFARAVYRRVAPALPAEVGLAVATKGIEEGSLALPLEVAAAELGSRRTLLALSGPSFAHEVARHKPTALVVAGSDPAAAQRFQELLASPALRLYTNGDPLGVQLGGALKNVVAIAAGIADGLDQGDNARAALITRGLAELTRLGVRMGARAETFGGLAGLGDLVLTCTGGSSRNHELGRRLGRGERLADVLEELHVVVEGVRTTRCARQLAVRHEVSMPIVEEVYRILFEGASAREGLARLMSRPLTSEAEA